MKYLVLFLLLGCFDQKIHRLAPTKPDYNRKTWEHWIDDDRDCQNERHEILIDTSLVPVTFRTDKGCTVDTGRWYDPYTAKHYTKASELDIDHVIPLKHAHDHGGYAWGSAKKRQFANDRQNLLAVEKGENRKKSADGPHLYMPPNEEYHCEYLQTWVNLKHKYLLRGSKKEDAFIFKKMGEVCEEKHSAIPPTGTLN